MLVNLLLMAVDFDPHYSCLSLFPPRSTVIPMMDRLLCCMLLSSSFPVDVAAVMCYVGSLFDPTRRVAGTSASNG